MAMVSLLALPKSSAGFGLWWLWDGIGALGKCELTESLPANFSDGRLTLAYGEYHLIVSEEVQQVKTEKIVTTSTGPSFGATPNTVGSPKSRSTQTYKTL